MHEPLQVKLERIARVRNEADAIARRLDEMEVERRALEERLVACDAQIHPDVMELGAIDAAFRSFSPPLTPQQALDCAMHYQDAVMGVLQGEGSSVTRH